MNLKKRLEQKMHSYCEECILPNAYDALLFFYGKGKKPSYEEYLDKVLSLMKGKKEDESC